MEAQRVGAAREMHRTIVAILAFALGTAVAPDSEVRAQSVPVACKDLLNVLFPEENPRVTRQISAPVKLSIVTNAGDAFLDEMRTFRGRLASAAKLTVDLEAANFANLPRQFGGDFSTPIAVFANVDRTFRVTERAIDQLYWLADEESRHLRVALNKDNCRVLQKTNKYGNIIGGVVIHSRNEKSQSDHDDRALWCVKVGLLQIFGIDNPLHGSLRPVKSDQVDSLIPIVDFYYNHMTPGLDRAKASSLIGERCE